jgi:hypothetical protein
MIKVFAESSMRHEQGSAHLAFFSANNARTVEVDVQLQGVVGCTPNQEWLALQGHWNDRSIPSCFGEEEVLPFLQSEEDDGLESHIPFHKLKDDRKVGLQMPELGWQSKHELSGVAQ